MAQFKPKEITSSKLDTTKVVTGQMILASDTGDLYFDSAANGRIHVSSIIIDDESVMYDKDFIKTHKNCLFISDGVVAAYSDGEKFIELNPYVYHNNMIFTSNVDFINLSTEFFDPNLDFIKLYVNGILLMGDGIDYGVYSVNSSIYRLKFNNTIEASEDNKAYIAIEFFRRMGTKTNIIGSLSSPK